MYSMVTIGNNIIWQDFPSGPVVEALHFQCGGRGFGPWSGN